ncbi:UDP-N-acetylmuramate dehydrogenase [Anaerosacchariphilus polymeriproducens]|uniref:UDP-N-acetylenolpyruvoylglucosamine reductase n=2 Tax=Anaerosacchariphilus polymeriproducens TaxID=1812858 RepID=A0A371ATH1_9FIRM|nr:UDP-N-acetylmuramate dehydrogenase [Anaerosacchariphilus polymeriproducens]RDU22780.1 UDP-N-acetylmuramate dehydrogenase [Anaerosacchariphilus polymeriproducens]
MLVQIEEIVGKAGVKQDEPMKLHTTFRIGGNADIYVQPKNAEEVAELLALCKEENFPYYIIGNGSNLLVGDKGFRGLIIEIGRNMSVIKIDKPKITVQAGAMLSQIANKALEEQLTGFEFASGIPGTFGGAVVMNAGAYGGEMKQIIESVTVLSQEGIIKKLSKSELELDYRSSCILKHNYIVLEGVIKLEQGEREDIKQRMLALKIQRIEKQPLEFPSAGSTFKRPEGHYAGKLIMDAGLRGYQIGDAQVAQKHCGFLINRKEAKASDMLELINYIKKEVRTKFGVELETEIKILGEF